MSEYIPDENAPQPEELTAMCFLEKDINNALRGLNEREEKVIRMRFGLDEGCPMTLEEIGRVFGVTRERIRQIEAKALRKLRHPSRSKPLKGYIE